jgi:hypothetical protein
LDDTDIVVQETAARVLAGGVVAEKFGLPAGEIDVV